MVGEGFKQLDLRWGEGVNIDAACGQDAGKFPLLEKGNGEIGSIPHRSNRKVVLRVNIGNMKRAMLADPTVLWFIDTYIGAARWYRTEMAPHGHSVPLAESQHHVIDSTNLGRALNDGVEDRLYVGGRAADNAEHL